MRWLVLALFVLVTAGIAAVRAGWIQLPSLWSPWASLEIEAAPNFLTRYKLNRLSRDAELCAAVLSSAAMSFERLSDRQTGPGCGLYGAVRVDRTTAEVGTPFPLTCPTAVSLALWERHVLQPAAERNFRSRIARLEHFGSYACRNIYQRAAGPRSRHATAAAIDIAGFVLADGRRIRVLGDWDETSQPGLFLHEVRDGACLFFDGVLGPDYNAAHRDHLHLDRGPYRVCR